MSVRHHKILWHTQIVILYINIHFLRCNVSKQSDWEATWSYVEESFGAGIQILVNNAGVSPAFGWKLCLDVNIYGVMMGSYIAKDRMGASKVCFDKALFH